MKKFKSYISEVKEPTGELKDACWKGYTAVGMKMKNGRKVPNCVPVKEEKDDVGEMIKDKLKIIINRAQEMHDHLKSGEDIPEWVKSKITLAQDYVSTACDYTCGKEQLGEETEQIEEVAAWQRKEGKSESGGLNRKGIESYRRENPGSKLSMAVTTKPSKLKPGSKTSNRRKSFCSRMSGLKKKLTSSETANDPDSRVNKALRKWNC